MWWRAHLLATSVPLNAVDASFVAAELAFEAKPFDHSFVHLVIMPEPLGRQELVQFQPEFR